MPCDIYVQIHQHGLTFYEIGVEYIMGVWNKVNALIKKSILRLIFFHFLKEKKKSDCSNCVLSYWQFRETCYPFLLKSVVNW